jgi:hypothetical protein
MARRVYFIFNFADAWRANQVRNSNVVNTADVAGFYDHSIYEECKDDAAVKREIANHLAGTTVSVVLIGSHTADRVWVRYEINESIKRGNGLIGIRIDQLIGPPPGWPSAPRYLWGPSSRGRVPYVPPPTEMRVYTWDAKQASGFARVIEQAAQGAEKIRQRGQTLSRTGPPPMPVQANPPRLQASRTALPSTFESLPPPRVNLLDLGAPSFRVPLPEIGALPVSPAKPSILDGAIHDGLLRALSPPRELSPIEEALTRLTIRQLLGKGDKGR